MAHLERRHVIARIALDVAEIEGAAVATQVGMGGRSFPQLQTEDTGGEAHHFLQIVAA